ncbi:MAG: NUDIX hydrolase [Deltaproteobacteria bacterium]|nr:NUDIX hydrolase [Deltaproteobacteria bacterium]
MDSNHGYLRILPDWARYSGNSGREEIEIVSDEISVNRIGKKRESSKFSGVDERFTQVGTVFEDEYIVVVRDPVKFPNGSAGTYLRIFERPSLSGASGVVLLPVWRGKIVLRNVFRHATRRWEIELPRGYREEGQSEMEAVKKELAEEVGLEPEKIERLGSIWPNTGLLATEVAAYYVLVGGDIPEPRPEPTEAFSWFVMERYDRLKDRISLGEIRDGFTLAAFQLAFAKGILV